MSEPQMPPVWLDGGAAHLGRQLCPACARGRADRPAAVSSGRDMRKRQSPAGRS